MKKRLKKLTIHRETLQRISPDLLKAVDGAFMSRDWICPGPSYQSPCETWENADSFCRVC
jgi:hypothetical protein